MTENLPVLPLRDIVVFPHMIVPLFVGREKSVAALESAMAADKSIFLVAQLDPAEDDPDREGRDDARQLGTTPSSLGDGSPRRAARNRKPLEQPCSKVGHCQPAELAALVDAIAEPRRIAAREDARIGERKKRDRHGAQRQPCHFLFPDGKRSRAVLGNRRAPGQGRRLCDSRPCREVRRLAGGQLLRRHGFAAA